MKPASSSAYVLSYVAIGRHAHVQWQLANNSNNSLYDSNDWQHHKYSVQWFATEKMHSKQGKYKVASQLWVGRAYPPSLPPCALGNKMCLRVACTELMSFCNDRTSVLMNASLSMLWYTLGCNFVPFSNTARFSRLLLLAWQCSMTFCTSGTWCCSGSMLCFLSTLILFSTLSMLCTVCLSKDSIGVQSTSGPVACNASYNM
jgi:hypothetical protein